MLVRVKINGSYVTIPFLQGANGLTPYIGINGHWWIGNTDTGTPATGGGTANVTKTLIESLLIGDVNFNANLFLSGKFSSGTFLVPQTIPTLLENEIALYSLESGFSGELPENYTYVHDHNDLYYTKEELVGLLEDLAPGEHNHDSRYFTKSEIGNSYYSKTDSDEKFAKIAGDILQDFSAKKLISSTLLIPNTAPTLLETELAIYALESGFTGELPVSADELYLSVALKGAINGLAELGADGKVKAEQLPEITGGGVTLGETNLTAYRGDRGKIAYDHSQSSHDYEASFYKNTAFNKDFGNAEGTVCQGNDSRLSDARNANDVYSWAKGASKPGYNFSEIGSKPTSISGYGITDAYTKTEIGTALGGKAEKAGSSSQDFAAKVLSASEVVTPLMRLPQYSSTTPPSGLAEGEYYLFIMV